MQLKAFSFFYHISNREQLIIHSNIYHGDHVIKLKTQNYFLQITFWGALTISYNHTNYQLIFFLIIRIYIIYLVHFVSNLQGLRGQLLTHKKLRKKFSGFYLKKWLISEKLLKWFLTLLYSSLFHSIYSQLLF